MSTTVAAVAVVSPPAGAPGRVKDAMCRDWWRGGGANSQGVSQARQFSTQAKPARRNFTVTIGMTTSHLMISPFLSCNAFFNITIISYSPRFFEVMIKYFV